MAATTAARRDTASELAYLTRALKAPTLRDAVPRLAERARAESWSHEEFLAACLQRRAESARPTERCCLCIRPAQRGTKRPGSGNRSPLRCTAQSRRPL